MRGLEDVRCTYSDDVIFLLTLISFAPVLRSLSRSWIMNSVQYDTIHEHRCEEFLLDLTLKQETKRE